MLARIFLAALVAAVTSLGAFAEAQVSPQSRTCTGNPDVDWTQQITSCSALIQSDQETTTVRARAYYNRGTAWRAKGDFDRAVADYTQAIDLNTNYAAAYNDRGLLLIAKGDSTALLLTLTKRSASTRTTPKPTTTALTPGPLRAISIAPSVT